MGLFMVYKCPKDYDAELDWIGEQEVDVVDDWGRLSLYLWEML